MKTKDLIFHCKSTFFKTGFLFLACVLSVAGELGASSMPGPGGKTFDIIRERIREDVAMSGNSSVEQLDSRIDALMPLIQADGSFEGLDYKNAYKSFGPPLRHLENVLRMSLAYTTKKSRFYQKRDLKNKIEKALDFWHESNPRNWNWWMNQIAAPQRMGQILLIMEDGREKLSPALMNKLLERMKTACGDPHRQTGANKTDVALHFMYRACLIRDTALMKESVKELFIPLSYTMKEGIQHDCSYLQHGPQLYTGGYGAVMIDGSVKTALYFAGTEFALSQEKLDIFSRFVREGYLPMIRGSHISWNVKGRGISRANSLSQKGLVSNLEKMEKIDPRYKKDYDQAISRLKGDQPPEYGMKPYSRYFYRSDYALHQRPGYTFDLRMVSPRTSRSETGNGEGLKNYFLSDGATVIHATGQEYVDIFPVWNWSRIPGVTGPVLPQIPTSRDWGARGTSPFVGGVSDGLYSAAAYLYGDTHQGINTSARKSWFMFDREVVCLGADIISENASPVCTTVNQCLLNGQEPSIREKGKWTAFGKGEKALKEPDSWVLHGGIGYYFPEGGNIRVEAAERQGRWVDINRGGSKDPVKKDVFTLYLDHGIQPKGGGYAYMIVPGLQKQNDLRNYSAGEVVIVENTGARQAVYHRGLNVLQAVFWTKGELKYKSMTLTVDQPCMILLKNAGSPRAMLYVADPSQSQEKISVQVKLPGRTINLSCDMKGEAYEKGKTKAFPLK